MIILTESQKVKFSDSITTKRMIAFSLQGIIMGFLFGMWGQVQYFAASVLLIPSTVIPLIYLVYSIVDGLNDPIIGYLADRSKKLTSKYGKRFPWIMIGVIVCPLLLIFNFVQISSNIAISALWLTIIMAVYETFASSFEINHSALFPDLFRNESDRRKVTVIGSVLGGIITIITAGLIPRLIDSIGYIGTVIIVVVIDYLLIIPYTFGIREPKEMKEFRANLDESDRGSSPLKISIKRVFKDKNWMGITIAGFTWSVAGVCWMAGLNFFVIHNLGLSIGYTAIPLLMQNLVGFLLAPVWTWISKKAGVRKAYIAGMLLNIITYLAFVFVSDIFGVIIVFTFGGIGFSATYGVIAQLLRAEGIDNATVNSGKREEGIYTGIFKIFTAFSYFLQTVVFAIVAGITGYEAALGTGNSDFAKFGLNFQMSIIPMIITLIGTIAFMLMYKISKEKASEIKLKLEEINL